MHLSIALWVVLNFCTLFVRLIVSIPYRRTSKMQLSNIFLRRLIGMVMLFNITESLPNAAHRSLALLYISVVWSSFPSLFYELSEIYLHTHLHIPFILVYSMLSLPLFNNFRWDTLYNLKFLYLNVSRSYNYYFRKKRTAGSAV